ncbi:MAG TPA: HAD-IIB family hydrolase [Candidatus Eisenbacteria bacterium]|jgi:mannosyl-3-phosphoglycerate phosphatase
MRPALFLVVYSDLDGTLLDHDRYDWAPATPALDRLRDLGVPLVLSSSKTRAEIERWRERLGNRAPFICENGGALYIPEGALTHPPAEAEREAGYRRVEYGAPHDELRKVLERIARRLDLPLRGFSSLPREELARRTELAGEDLDLALRREYDEPFVAEPGLGPEEEARLRAEVRKRGLRVTKGGRFYHLLGANSKARAAADLTAAYAREWGTVTTAALGDGPNDLELLRAAAHPVVVARPDGSHAPELSAGIPRAYFARGVGPHGFAEGVFHVLSRLLTEAPARKGPDARGQG